MNTPRALYYICLLNDLQSIIKNGIYSRAAMKDKVPKGIHDPSVLARRTTILPNGKSLQQHANLYFQPRNAMLYRLKCNLLITDLVILEISPEVLGLSESFVSDRNAASSLVNFYDSIDGLKKIDGDVFKKKYWTDSDDTKQKMMAEVLVYERVAQEYITSVFLPSSKRISEAKKLLGSMNCVVEPDMFFLPTWRKRLNEKIFLSKGDMFFSSMQTFTISVNLKGIMGKGLASRTKYQFPDAYVRYQDDCKAAKLKVGKPTIFKRAIRIEEELADDATQLKPESLNGNRWFLFFPTKRHWRESSRFSDVELSMQWLLKNYHQQKINSIALPALGCGLGNLQWQQVGPMMCYYLNQMNIQSCIYLPMEKEILDDHCEPEFLLQSYQPTIRNQKSDPIPY